MIKAKNLPQSRIEKLMPWRPVLLAACATLISLLLRAYTNRLDLNASSVLYLVGIANFDLLAFIAICINVIVMIFYIREIGNLEPGSVTKLGLTTFLLFLSTGSFGHAITHKNSIRIDQTVYHLVAEKESNSGTAIHLSYVVLECDSLGIACHYYARPFKTLDGCFQDKAMLEQSPDTANLIMVWERYDEETTTIPVRAGDNAPLVGCEDEI